MNRLIVVGLVLSLAGCYNWQTTGSHFTTAHHGSYREDLDRNLKSYEACQICADIGGDWTGMSCSKNIPYNTIGEAKAAGYFKDHADGTWSLK